MENAQQHIMQGLEHKENGNHKAAITEFNKALELDSKNEDAYAFRGGSFGSLGEWDKAIADYTQAIDLNQRDENYVSRGIAYFMAGKHTEARPDFEEALRLNPENINAKAALAELVKIGC